MTVKVEVILEEETCITCGCVFAILSDLKKELKRTHNTFYCPVGHSMFFLSKTDAEIWQERTEKAKLEILKIQQEKADVEKQLANLTKRVDAGLCPHCRRHFANLERHIQSKHTNKEN